MQPTITNGPAHPAPSLGSDGFRLASAPVLGWAFYDFANTIFSYAVITRYFNEWVIDQHGRPDWQVAVMGFVVGLVLIPAMPAAGAVSDRYGRRLPFLAAFTAVSVTATAVLGLVSSVTLALVVAGIAIFGFQLALSMYDPLLATVAPAKYRGRVSGLGVGLGYVGVLIGSVALGAIVPDSHLERAFLPTAAMFGALSIPIFLFVRERPAARTSDDAGSLGSAARAAVGQLARTVSHIRSEHGDVGRFLLARFLYVDAIATVIAYMTIYMGRVGDFSKVEKTAVLGLAMVFAAAGAFVAGVLVERLGPKPVLRGTLVLAASTLLVAAATGSASLVWVLGPAIGVTLGAVATSDRVFMMRLSPADLRGEFFGIYNLVGKLSSGVGPLVLWAGTIWLLHSHGSWGLLSASRAALAMLAVAVVAGLLVLGPLSDRDRFPDAAAEGVKA